MINTTQALLRAIPSTRLQPFSKPRKPVIPYQTILEAAEIVQTAYECSVPGGLFVVTGAVAGRAHGNQTRNTSDVDGIINKTISRAQRRLMRALHGAPITDTSAGFKEERKRVQEEGETADNRGLPRRLYQGHVESGNLSVPFDLTRFLIVDELIQHDYVVYIGKLRILSDTCYLATKVQAMSERRSAEKRVSDYEDILWMATKLASERRRVDRRIWKVLCVEKDLVFRNCLNAARGMGDERPEAEKTLRELLRGVIE